MPRLCKDIENDGDICKKLIEKKICMNGSKGIKCKANWGEAPGVITEEKYQEILLELGLAKAEKARSVPNHSHNANVGSKPKKASVRNANVRPMPKEAYNKVMSVVDNEIPKEAYIKVVDYEIPKHLLNANVGLVQSNTDKIVQLVNTTESLETLIESELIRKSCNDYAQSLEGSKGRQQVVFDLFQTVTTDNFYKLLKSLKPVITHEEIQSFRASVLEQINHPYFGYIVMKELYNFVLDIVRNTHHDTNSSYKLLTAQNVLITEDMENLDIRDMDHLYDLFKDFKYFNKDSASTSLVFTAKLKDLDKDFIAKKTTLQPNQTFYFKAFPVGEVVNVYERKVNYRTEGLQTELSMYAELFKLQKYNITPNILCKIALIPNITGFGQFLKKTNMLEEAKQKTFDQVNPLLYVPPSTVWDKVSIISTHPGGPELFNIFGKLTPDERKEVMFQIIYNLYVFDKLQISQGDMHALNIKVNILSKPIPLYYIVNGYTYAFQTKHLVKFFDLDFGMIGKTTKLKFDYDGHVTDTIRKIENPNRSPDKSSNYTYGITDIYNPNLDIVKLFMNGAVGLHKIFPNLRLSDPEFTKFVSLVFPGMFSYSKIADTYASLLVDPNYRKEAAKIYGSEDTKKWAISDDVLNSTWIDYFMKCKQRTTGYIVKDFQTSVPNNQLWIPDTIVSVKAEMLEEQYFSSFYKRNPYRLDVTKQMVYSIDGVIA